MCGRYVLKAAIKELTEKYGAVPDGFFAFEPVYNVAPTLNMPVISRPENETKISLYRWGLIPSWAKDARTGYSMINARSESLTEKKSYTRPFRNQRCIVPANGFYEWKTVNGKKIPYYITLSDPRLMSFAGLYEHWKDPEGKTVSSFTIITTPAADAMEPLHDRMPALLLEEEINDWLNPANSDTGQLQDLLHPYPSDDIKFMQVSAEVNNVRNQGASLIDPLKDLFS